MVGVIAVLTFLVTGQFMKHHTPPMASLSDAARLMYRSRHIYILASGLVNAMLGLYIQPRTRWRMTAQRIGSILLISSPALLIVAFAVEPERGLQPEMWWSAAGLYALFGGRMAHLASAIGQPMEQPVKILN